MKHSRRQTYGSRPEDITRGHICAQNYFHGGYSTGIPPSPYSLWKRTKASLPHASIISLNLNL